MRDSDTILYRKRSRRLVLVGTPNVFTYPRGIMVGLNTNITGYSNIKLSMTEGTCERGERKEQRWCF